MPAQAEFSHGLLELFAREVMPEFHANIPAHEEWKRKVLAGEIELEEIDTQPFRDRFGPNSVQVAQTHHADTMRAAE